ncbi:MAG: hypothetical protein KKF76_09455, partial [Gammaproteobacteria bacterium]|nr:hypothetical protein [Gammaproteobacteria bacterium]
ALREQRQVVVLGQQRQAVGEKIAQLGIPSRVSRHNMGVDRTLYKRPSTMERALLRGVSSESDAAVR